MILLVVMLAILQLQYRQICNNKALAVVMIRWTAAFHHPVHFLRLDPTDETGAVRKDEDLELRLQHLLEQLGDESFFNFQESCKGAVLRNFEVWCSNMLEGMVESSGAVATRACKPMKTNEIR